MARKKESFLIINPYGIGDVLFSTVLLKNIKIWNFEAPVYYLCNKRSAPLVQYNERVAGVFIYERDEFEALKKQSYFLWIRALWQLILSVRHAHIDTVFDLSLHPFFGCICLLAGIKNRIGFNYKRRGIFLTRKLPFEGFTGRHVADYFLDLLKAVPKIPVSRKCQLDLVVQPEAAMWAQQRIASFASTGRRRVVGFSPFGGASWGADAQMKQWPVESFAMLIDAVAAEYDSTVLIFAGPSEIADSEILFKKLQEKEHVLLINNESLEHVVALIDQCVLFVGNDGGLLHIAGALHKKIIGFYGPVNEEEYGIYPHDSQKHAYMVADIACRPCYKKFRYPQCEKQGACLSMISAEDVFVKMKEML